MLCAASLGTRRAKRMVASNVAKPGAVLRAVSTRNHVVEGGAVVIGCGLLLGTFSLARNPGVTRRPRATANTHRAFGIVVAGDSDCRKLVEAHVRFMSLRLSSTRRT